MEILIDILALGMGMSLLYYSYVAMDIIRKFLRKQKEERGEVFFWPPLFLCVLLGYTTKDIVVTIFLIFYVIASIIDGYTKKVADVFHLIPFIAAFGFIIADILRKDSYLFHFGWIDYLFLFAPMIFCLFTIHTRGMADTLFMMNLWVLYIYLNRDMMVLLISYFLGYMIQFMYRVLYCKEKHLAYTDNTLRLPFLPSLFGGFLICFVLL